MSRGERTPYGLQHRARGRVVLDKVPVEEWSWAPFDAKGALLRPQDGPAPSTNAAQTNYRPSRRTQDVVLVLETGVQVANLVSLRPVARHLYLHRWMQPLRDLRGLLRDDVLWMPSHPLNGSNEWQDKLAELSYAKELGLRVPESIYTNDPSVAAAFIRRCGGRVLFRDFSQTPRRRARRGSIGVCTTMRTSHGSRCGCRRPWNARCGG